MIDLVNMDIRVSGVVLENPRGDNMIIPTDKVIAMLIRVVFGIREGGDKDRKHSITSGVRYKEVQCAGNEEARMRD